MTAPLWRRHRGDATSISQSQEAQLLGRGPHVKFGGMTALPIETRTLAPETARKLRELTTRWTDVAAAERANYQLYLTELCEAIGVERPRPAAIGGRTAEGVAYQFEFPMQTTTREGVVSTNFIDLYKSGSFALEAKHAAEVVASGISGAQLRGRSATGRTRAYSACVAVNCDRHTCGVARGSR